jgi:hypothetical protein
MATGLITRHLRCLFLINSQFLHIQNLIVQTIMNRFISNELFSLNTYQCRKVAKHFAPGKSACDFALDREFNLTR